MGEQAGWLCAGLLVNVVISTLVGAAKNDVVAGLVYGLLLGPIGWLIVLVSPAKRRRAKEEYASGPGQHSQRDEVQSRQIAAPAKPERKRTEKELCYFCGKPLEPTELALRVCQACRA
jgi:hypothetical protein